VSSGVEVVDNLMFLATQVIGKLLTLLGHQPSSFCMSTMLFCVQKHAINQYFRK